jgi:malate dehydrogenase (oxaloacetate-decarboxylating)(NADP+)
LPLAREPCDGVDLPAAEHICDASLDVAERITSLTFDQGLAGVPRSDDVGALVRACACRPSYPG